LKKQAAQWDSRFCAITFGKRKGAAHSRYREKKKKGLHMEMEKKNSSNWKEIESKAGGNDGTLAVYFLYYVVYYFNHV
jgi:hypothetical protein